MKKDIARLTVSQFAKLHHVNKRTLHYYDSIGLFRLNLKAITTIDTMTIPKVWILNLS